MNLKEAISSLHPEQAKAALARLADKIDGNPDGKLDFNDLNARIAQAAFQKVERDGAGKILVKVLGLLAIGAAIGVVGAKLVLKVVC